MLDGRIRITFNSAATMLSANFALCTLKLIFYTDFEDDFGYHNHAPKYRL